MSPSLGHTPSLEARTEVKVMGCTVVFLAEDIDSTPVAWALTEAMMLSKHCYQKKEESFLSHKTKLSP